MKQSLGNYPSTSGKLSSISTPISRTFLQRAGTVASQYAIFSINTIFKEKMSHLDNWESGERNPHCFHSSGYCCPIFFPFLCLGIPPNIPRPVSHLHRSSERHRGTSKIYEAFISHRIFIQNTSWHLYTDKVLFPVTHGKYSWKWGGLSGLIQVLRTLHVNTNMAPKFQKCVSGVIQTSIMEADLKFPGLCLEIGTEHVKQWAIPAKI